MNIAKLMSSLFQRYHRQDQKGLSEETERLLEEIGELLVQRVEEKKVKSVQITPSWRKLYLTSSDVYPVLEHLLTVLPPLEINLRYSEGGCTEVSFSPSRSAIREGVIREWTEKPNQMHELLLRLAEAYPAPPEVSLELEPKACNLTVRLPVSAKTFSTISQKVILPVITAVLKQFGEAVLRKWARDGEWIELVLKEEEK